MIKRINFQTFNKYSPEVKIDILASKLDEVLDSLTPPERGEKDGGNLPPPSTPEKISKCCGEIAIKCERPGSELSHFCGGVNGCGKWCEVSSPSTVELTDEMVDKIRKTDLELQKSYDSTTDWEKEFDELWYESFDNDGGKNVFEFENLKIYVRNLLQSQKEEMREKLKYVEYKYFLDSQRFYKESDIEDLLKS